jgi:steroid 5-alpha reductase family enzyme
LIRVSGVSLLEKSLKHRTSGYEEYMRRTSSSFPWPPKHG